jgi:hypothetical protein
MVFFKEWLLLGTSFVCLEKSVRSLRAVLGCLRRVTDDLLLLTFALLPFCAPEVPGLPQDLLPTSSGGSNSRILPTPMFGFVHSKGVHLTRRGYFAFHMFLPRSFLPLKNQMEDVVGTAVTAWRQREAYLRPGVALTTWSVHELLAACTRP